jgi:hypothetical protein
VTSVDPPTDAGRPGVDDHWTGQGAPGIVVVMTGSLPPAASSPSWYARPAARSWACAPAPAEVLAFHSALPGYAPTPLVELVESVLVLLNTEGGRAAAGDRATGVGAAP